MARPEPLDAAQLYRRCNLDNLTFASTGDLEPLADSLGQSRAIEALRFGAAVRAGGFNLFALGPSGLGKHATVMRALREQAASEPSPTDWLYVHNFRRPNEPAAIALPAGRGQAFADDLSRLVEDLRTDLPASFESEHYQSRIQEIQRAFGERQREAFEALREEAEGQGIALLQTPGGFTFAPQDENGEVMESEKFRELPEDRRHQLQETVEELQEKLQNVISQIPRWRKETQNRVRELNEEMAAAAIDRPLADLLERWRDFPDIVEHLNAIRRDVIENIDTLTSDHGRQQRDALFSRYRANVIVDNGGLDGAPVVYEDLPTHQHLIGRVDHFVQQGTLLTDFRLIKPGAMHRANGGYLVLDAQKLLSQPGAWESLKRTLHSGTVRIESLERAFGFMSTVSLEPAPIPLRVKVVLLGERRLYYLLSAYDPDFPELFKVEADFEEDLERSDESETLYARAIAAMVGNEGLLPVDRDGVARIIEHGSRLAGDKTRLTGHERSLFDLLHEADHRARQSGRAVIGAAHVDEAIDRQRYRSGRVREWMDRQIRDSTILIATAGEFVGQVNGLSVIQLGGTAFGRPARITATTRLGRGQMVDIEREARLGGHIHSKGVMILSNLLASRFAGERPLSLAASLAFEQSYGLVDGDSASVAEYCVLVSSLAEAPIRQNLAVTGSVNQHGQVQAVGGVNEKVEGFFDVCRSRGLTGNQGVALPAANVRHLMLREDVRDAVAEGGFRIYAMETVEDAVELLMGLPAGTRQADGRFPPKTLNHRVDERLRYFAELSRRRAADITEGRRDDEPDNPQ